MVAVMPLASAALLVVLWCRRCPYPTHHPPPARGGHHPHRMRRRRGAPFPACTSSRRLASDPHRPRRPIPTFDVGRLREQVHTGGLESRWHVSFGGVG